MGSSKTKFLKQVFKISMPQSIFERVDQSPDALFSYGNHRSSRARASARGQGTIPCLNLYPRSFEERRSLTSSPTRYNQEKAEVEEAEEEEGDIEEEENSSKRRRA
jgi:hypothetical protein